MREEYESRDSIAGDGAGATPGAEDAARIQVLLCLDARSRQRIAVGMATLPLNNAVTIAAEVEYG